MYKHNIPVESIYNHTTYFHIVFFFMIFVFICFLIKKYDRPPSTNDNQLLFLVIRYIRVDFDRKNAENHVDSSCFQKKKKKIH